jgi:hypothetical protein
LAAKHALDLHGCLLLLLVVMVVLLVTLLAGER